MAATAAASPATAATVARGAAGAGAGGAAVGAASGKEDAPAQRRERLELEDFEVPGGGAFDSVQWLNARLASTGVPFEKLEQHLTSLAMRCQLLCTDTSQSIDVASSQLVAQLPATSRDLERMRDQAVRGHERLGQVLDGLRDADDRKQSGLQGLAEIDAVKTRVETACAALKEVVSWERKVEGCQKMVHSGKLPTALAQLASLKGVLDAFRMLPEYAKKETQIQQLEETLLGTARRKARAAVERNVVADLAACGEVFAAMGRREEPLTIARAVFAEVAERAWQGQAADASAGALASAVQAVFEAIAQSFRERWPLLQSLDEEPTAEGQSDALRLDSGVVLGAAIASAVRAALAALSGKLDRCLAAGAAGEGDGDFASREESSAHQRASRAVALLAVYGDGFEALAQVAPMAEAPGLWAEACRDAAAPGIVATAAEAAAEEALPWSLLREIATYVIWRPMQDDAQALVPLAHGQVRASEAVLAAETNAKKLMQMPAAWARYLEDKGGARLGVVWVACIDVTCEAYWRKWDSLVDAFQRELSSRSGDSGSPHDSVLSSGLLSECMQLHTMLHDSLAVQFQAFQSQVLQHAARLLGGPAAQTAFGRAIAEKLSDERGAWCDRLAAPSIEALRAAATALGALPSAEPGAFARQAPQALPAAAAALAQVERQARALVTQCCAQPAAAALAGYSEAAQWTRASQGAEATGLLAGGLSPLPSITAVGEHLFALMPQLEQERREGGQEQVHWLPDILDAVVDTAIQKVVQIRQLTQAGAQQLIADLEYLHKVTDAIGREAAQGSPVAGAGGGVAGAGPGTENMAAARLAEVLAALTFLASQQQRQRECAARGEAFAEAQRAVPAPTAPGARRAERALRAALGLAGAGPGAALAAGAAPAAPAGASAAAM